MVTTLGRPDGPVNPRKLSRKPVSSARAGAEPRNGAPQRVAVVRRPQQPHAGLQARSRVFVVFEFRAQRQPKRVGQLDLVLGEAAGQRFGCPGRVE